MAEQSDLSGATVYEAAERPSIGGGRWYALPNDTTYFKPTSKGSYGRR